LTAKTLIHGHVDSVPDAGHAFRSTTSSWC
jgi:hypothetical protein